ncbi:HAD-IA family hydrolase [Synechococcus elongatus]|uniref:HAD-IA family hydrolase n=1 Tax=Synechococcus elongatus TaxID=32046 RepID=UPI000F7F111E|nr:HAD-IA family hydrolase [Synechococcus elongatus]
MWKRSWKAFIARLSAIDPCGKAVEKLRGFSTGGIKGGSFLHRLKGFSTRNPQVFPQSYPQTLQAIIFDFDGTLVDSLPTVVAIANAHAPDFGYDPIDERDYAQLRQWSSRTIVRRAGLSPWQQARLLQRVQRQLGDCLPALQLFPGVADLLAQLRSRSLCLGILSSNSRQNIEAFLQRQGLRSLFSVIQAGTPILSKRRALSQLVAREGWQPAAVMYVGDETRDVEAARQVGLIAVAVTWGFNDRQSLVAACPDWLLETPSDLLQAVTQLMRQ